MNRQAIKLILLVASIIVMCDTTAHAQEDREPFVVQVRTDKGKVPMAFRLDGNGKYADAGYQEYNRPAVAPETEGELFVPDSITAPDGRRLQVRWITRGCFQGCQHITKVHLPAGIRTISDLAFQNCTSLREVTLSDSLQVIYPQAFAGCESIRRIVLRSAEPPRTYNHDTFDESVTATATLVLPAGSADAYKHDNTFSRFRYRMTLIEGEK